MPSTTFIPNTPPPVDETVANNGWFPDLSLSDLRAQRRIGNDVDNVALAAYCREAMLAVNDALAEWQAVQQTGIRPELRREGRRGGYPGWDVWDFGEGYPGYERVDKPPALPPGPTYASLADVSSTKLGDASRLTLLYMQAVFARSKRMVLEGERDLDTRRAGIERADGWMQTIDYLRVDEDRAVRAIRGERGSVHASLM
jgi:hypothetical protein